MTIDLDELERTFTSGPFKRQLDALIRIARAAKEYRKLSGSVVDNRKWWAAKLELDDALEAVK